MTPGPAGAPRANRPARVVLATALVAVVAAGGTVTALTLTGGDDGGREEAGRVATPTAPVTAPGGTPAVSGPPSPATSATAPGPSSITPPPAASPAPAPAAPGIPAGYRRASVSGVSLLVPETWARTTDGSGNVAFQAPDGVSRIVVRVLRGDTADPYAEQAGSETETRNGYPGYERLELSRGTFGGGDCATWEYRFTGGDGRRFVRDVRWRAGGNSYNLWIAVPGASDPDRARAHLRVALDSLTVS